LQYFTATKTESNLAATGHTPSVDTYTNTLYTSLTAANIVRITALDGSYRSNITGAAINNPQTVTLYSNSLYTATNSGGTSYIVRIPFTAYPSTTFTFSNVGSNVQVQNATGIQVTVAVAGGTVTNSNLPSIPNISDVKTLYNTTGTTYTLL
jgi:hypothetical protein